MGSVYISTCEKEGKILDNLVKIGLSSYDIPLKRTKGVSRKFKNTGMTHKCHTYYVTDNYKDIEKHLLKHFKEQRANNIYGRPRRRKELPPKLPHSIEHFKISMDTALSAFKKIIEELEKHSVEHVQCSSYNCHLYRPIGKK